ncbi:hypothetical protein [Chryseobacterium sp. EO14]|uniref:hypothetical protein n=1 Tax=Chryseobacterium sp. EO14 TaxID=2950551 RepID=UPI00210B948B|nr:hypothetical protein [Chryseobacterium sp. EO14]MCQ4142003.1 hypothetical protein [Chryseobacterium sp. EO14]
MLIHKQYDIQSLFPIDHPPFVRVVLYYLKQHGITEFGGVSYFSQIDYEDIEKSLHQAGFKEKGYIDKLIIEEWNKADKTYSLFTLTGFAYNFQTNYRNWNIEKYTSVEVQNRNQKLRDKYYELVTVINRLQGYLDSFELRLRIDSNYIDRETIYQCLTPFCTISVKCDELGNFSIEYALAPDLRSMITDLLASILEKRILDIQMSDLKDYITPTVFESKFKDRFITRLKENSLFYKGFKKDFPIYVLRNKF